MLPAICAALAIALAVTPAGDRQRPARRAAQAPTHATATQRKAPRPGKPVQGGTALDRARAQLAEVKQDPAQRRYRDRWERAIHALEKAARGRDAAPALLDAARGRYALYRFSQVEADRDAALQLARKADRAGAHEGAMLARAIRKEMGEDPAPQKQRGSAAASSPAHRAPSSTAKAAPRPARERKEAVADARAPDASPPLIPAAPLAPRTPLVVPGRDPAAASGAPVRQEAAPEVRDDDAEDEGPVDGALEKALAEESEPVRPAGGAAPGPARVSDVKSWSNHDYTRVAVYLSRPVEFTREDLAPTGEQPRRVALDLRPARVARALAREVGDALVLRVRTAQLDPDTVRVVLDLAGKEDLTVFALQDPPRLILDVGSAAPERGPDVASAPPRPPRAGDAAGGASGGTSAPPAPPGVAAAPRAVPAPPPVQEDGELLSRGTIRRIIVDAGHGGHDTGAIGPSGVREKDVTLAMARRLARRLESRGFEVVLTRSYDRYVALEERTAIANARHGDLFVSLHANAHPRRDRRGVETYVLNVADDRYAARLAARENGALGDGAADIPVLRRILSDLDAKVSAEASRRLARAVQREICAGVRGRVGDVRDLGVKSALFYVLLGARMPAVLVEAGFISNRVEEQRLRSAAFQDEVASAVLRAVEGFASREAHVASLR